MSFVWDSNESNELEYIVEAVGWLVFHVSDLVQTRGWLGTTDETCTTVSSIFCA